MRVLRNVVCWLRMGLECSWGSVLGILCCEWISYVEALLELSSSGLGGGRWIESHRDAASRFLRSKRLKSIGRRDFHCWIRVSQVLESYIVNVLVVWRRSLRFQAIALGAPSGLHNACLRTM